jgi:2-polyprenyl-6-methoxyphenol hydroxylase-like FAD-dependent oxidoreductase
VVRKLLKPITTYVKEKQMKALVIGGGIGGLSAAVGLKNAGIHCEVFEAVKEIKPVGAAISIWPNGVKCMKHLGMGDIIESYGGPMHFLAYKDYLRGEDSDPVQPRSAGRAYRRPPLSGFPRRAAARDARLLGTRRRAVW